MGRPIGAGARLGCTRQGWAIRIGYTYQMHLTSAPYLLPISSLLAGLFLLLAPRVVSFAAAVYLIFVGLLGLNGIYHLFK
jgi:Protein of unknown function (DUF3096)